MKQVLLFAFTCTGIIFTAGCGNQWIAAVKRNDLSAVKSMLDKGADINAKEDSIGATALYEASFNGYTQLTGLLLERGAYVHVSTNEGFTPLHAASQQGHLEIVRMLINHGADISAQNNNNTTPLHLAALKGRKEMVELLVNLGADIHAEDRNGLTPLHSAAGGGDVATLETLISFGTDINVRTNSNWSPLHYAAKYDREEAFAFLVNKGAETDAIGLDNGVQGATYYQLARYYEKKHETSKAMLNYEKAIQHLELIATQYTLLANERENQIIDIIYPEDYYGNRDRKQMFYSNFWTGVEFMSNKEVQKLLAEMQQYRNLSLKFKNMTEKAREKKEHLRKIS
jgi:ankyrin repeat protein